MSKKSRKKPIEDDKSKIDAYLRNKSKAVLKCEPAYASGAERGATAKAREKKRKSE